MGGFKYTKQRLGWTTSKQPRTGRAEANACSAFHAHCQAASCGRHINACQASSLRSQAKKTQDDQLSGFFTLPSPVTRRQDDQAPYNSAFCLVIMQLVQGHLILNDSCRLCITALPCCSHRTSTPRGHSVHQTLQLVSKLSFFQSTSSSVHKAIHRYRHKPSVQKFCNCRGQGSHYLCLG